MFPRRGYKLCSHAREDVVPASFWVRGADISAVAFIDGHGRGEIGRGGFDALEEGDPAVAQWLTQADVEPQVAYAGPAAFVEGLHGARCRGAIAIVEPTVYLDDDGTPIRAVFGALNDRVGAGHPEPSGAGATDKKRFFVELSDDSATIVHWQRFRIESPLDLRGRYAGAEHAAFGWLKVSYILHADGRAEAHCASSFVPSVWFYRDHNRVFRHDMFAMAAADVERCLRPKAGASSGTTWTAIDTSSGYVHAVA